jgi:lipopolysaccharide/colanic/teichoic acid biosynthesis glycosyltransferase
MLLESENLLMGGDRTDALDQILEALRISIRETDTIGWQEKGSVIGIIFTEIGPADGKIVAGALLKKVSNALASNLSIEQINHIRLSFHIFPEDWSNHGGTRSHEPELFPDNMPGMRPKRGLLVAKRGLDILGSFLAIVLLAPVFLVVAVAVKLTSNGPIFFRQRRVGQYGRDFTFLKFRSMHCKSSESVHQDYVKRFIAGQVDGNAQEQPSAAPTVYKLTNDPRLTRIGSFLRKSSVDELPQFFNVLQGNMSLVGPRPPIPYEVEIYSPWHRRRLLSVKPGITGLWQVTGRSKVTFDEMVRLDLRYARSWSLWLDIKILLKTPRAVLGGVGAC